jgi:hypothetical protein
MSQAIDDLDVVALLRDLPEEGLERGQAGTVVLTHGKGEAYEVEFILPSSQPNRSIVATIRKEDLLKLKGFKRLPEPATAEH